MLCKYIEFKWLFTCLIVIWSGASAQTNNSMVSLQDVAPAFALADSGPKRSGQGEEWSEWYRLGVGMAPKGYTVSNVEFWLTGERNCGQKAECRQVLRSNRQVLWEFRLRGDGTQPVFSEGHIRVSYRHE